MPVRFDDTFEVASEPARMFEVLDAIERTPEWFTRCTRVERVDPTNGLGTKLRYHIVQRPPTAVAMDASIVGYARDAHFAVRLTDQALRFDVTVDFKLAPVAGGTRVAVRIDVVMHSLAGKLVQPILRRVLPKQLALDMAKLRALI